MTDTVTLTIELPEDAIDKLRYTATAHGITVEELIQNFIIEMAEETVNNEIW